MLDKKVKRVLETLVSFREHTYNKHVAGGGLSWNDSFKVAKELVVSKEPKRRVRLEKTWR